MVHKVSKPSNRCSLPDTVVDVRRWLAILLAAAAVAACSTPSASNQLPAEQDRRAALFYAKDGRLYISDPVGAPGRPITDGPADTQPAPSPDGKRVAFVRKQTRNDYGGELWVIELTSDSTPAGSPRRLVDPADLGPAFGGQPPKVSTPRWSPTGERIAFMRPPADVAGGSLITAAADTGEVLIGADPPFVDPDYAWAPDGRRIAWVSGRSDVRAADVGVLTVGGSSIVVAKGTNASAAAFGDEGKTVLFGNSDSTDPNKFPTTTPFALRSGGIYSVPADGGTTAPVPLVRGSESYSNVTVLNDGAIAFTVSDTGRPQASGRHSIEIFQAGKGAPEVVADYAGGGYYGGVPPPVWTPDGVVAYIGAAEDMPLMIMDRDDRTARQVDSRGVGAIAWPPRR